MRRTTFFCVVLFLTASATAWAEPIINVGDHLFLPGETKTFALYASGDVAVQGLNLYLQIGDGGTANYGTGTKPKITAVDIVGPVRTGLGPATLFNGNTPGQSNDFTSDLLWAVSTITTADTVLTANTRTLAFVTINTTGTAAGQTYPLLLKGTSQGLFGYPVDTDFGPIAATITNGSITIVPEPSTIVLLASLLALLSVVAWRRKRLAA